MNIEKLPSGSYRARLRIDGCTYRRTFDHKPTRKEILAAIAEEMEENEKSKIFTFQKACDKYLESKKSILSPSTYAGYKRIINNFPKWFLEMPVDDIGQINVNKVINDYAAAGISPKTLRNRHGFISAVLGTFKPSLVLNTTLPKKTRKEPYIPSTEDVKKILEYSKDTEYEIVYSLACYGMRKSEILGLELSDIEGTTVHIHQVKVLDENNKLVTKDTTKTETSTRDIVIPKELARKIKKQGYVTKLHSNSFNDHLTYAQKKLGIPHFSFHKFRHYFASQLSDLGIKEADILYLGGWKTDRVMKEIYRHSMMNKKKNAKKEASDKLAQLIF
ncbi:MAG: site-specific integrase [Lachnospiraceae bacterium]|nr:site-specific integrase [Lachnospiraceae bacterium]